MFLDKSKSENSLSAIRRSSAAVNLYQRSLTMKLTELPSDLKDLWEDKRKNRALRKYRAAILRRHYTELCVVFNLDRLDGHFTSENIEPLLSIADKLRVLIIMRYKPETCYCAELIELAHVQVRFIPQEIYNLGAEMHIGDNEVFVSDGKIHNAIKSPRFSTDMRSVFDGMWKYAEKMPTTISRIVAKRWLNITEC